MRHAICVTGYGNKAEVLQRTIHILDDPDIDFLSIGISAIISRI